MNIADRPAAARAATAKTADLTVVGGAGHVGIPLVLSFAAKGLTVNVNDINEQTLATLKSGRVPFIENGAQPLLTKALADKRLFFTSRPSEISTSGPVIITIGTPVDEFLNPVRSVIQECIDALLPHLRDGQLAGAAVDALSRHHGMDRRSHQAAGPQPQGRVLSRAHRPGPGHRGTCAACRSSSAAPRPRRSGRRRRCSGRSRRR